LECLLGRAGGEPVELSRVTWQIAPNLDLAPAKADLATLEPRLVDRNDADELLHGLLQENAGRYDYCVVDCPPHLGPLMRNGLRAASEVVIPVDTGFFSLHGLTRQLATMEELGARFGNRPKVRVLPNQYDVRTKLAREILAEVRNKFKGVVLETIINFNTKLKEGASFGQPITEFAPNSMGAKDFQKLAREVIAGEPPRVATSELLAHMEKLAADAERLLATTTTLVGSGRPAPSAPVAVAPADLRTARTPDSAARTAPVLEIDASVRLEPIRVTTPPETIVRPVSPFASTPTHMPVNRVEMTTLVPSPEETERKIEAIYGARQDGEVVVFRSRQMDAAEVQIAGDFNDWMPHTTPMRRLADGDYEARLRLPRGRYRYRLVIDGRWSHDAYNPCIETNEYGELNSVIDVQK
jgi:chromosome partitioning protein